MKLRALMLVPMAVALSACESTSRFDGMVSSRPMSAAQPEPGVSVPTSPVTSEALPPVAGGEPPPATSDLALGDASGSAMAGAPQESVPSAPPPATPTVRGLVGNWRISDAARGNCSIALTQQTLLDLYRAAPSGCQAGSLAKVNAWQQRGQELVLIEQGGRTAVRLFPKGDGTYEGAATTSGAIIRMSR